MFGARKQEQRELIIAYKRVFGTPEGKQVLYDLMNRFHILNPIRGDSIERAEKEGQRQVVSLIMGQCAINLNQLDEMLKGESE